jgi:hypothetical protein
MLLHKEIKTFRKKLNIKGFIMKDYSSSTKQELLIKVNELSEQLIKEREITIEALESSIAKNHVLSDFISICKIVRSNF